MRMEILFSNSFPYPTMTIKAKLEMWIRTAIQIQEQLEFPTAITHKFLNLLQREKK